MLWSKESRTGVISNHQQAFGRVEQRRVDSAHSRPFACYRPEEDGAPRFYQIVMVMPLNLVSVKPGKSSL